MPPPKRSSPDDFYDRLPESAVAHLRALRQLCRDGLPDATEVLHWNSPAFVQDGTRLLVLQAFSAHGSLRFPTRQFATQRALVTSAGFDAGAGFIKLPYGRDLPTELLRTLIAARLEEYLTTGAGW